MPYKDPEKRRAYHTAYNRKWRARNPSKVKESLQRWRKSEHGKAKIKARRRTEAARKYHRDWMRRTYHAEDSTRRERLASSKKWHETHPDRIMAHLRKHKLMQHYGITEEQYQELLKKQNGVCALCCKLPDSNRRLAVDHNHKTGKIRGLLCSRCNNLLGQIERLNYSVLALYLYFSRQLDIKQMPHKGRPKGFGPWKVRSKEGG
jgi:hypothetical protein